MRRFWPFAGIVGGLAAAGGLLWFAFAPVAPVTGHGARTEKVSEDKATEAKVSKPVAARPKPATQAAGKPAVSRPKASAEERDEWVESRKPEHRKLAAAIVAAIDDNDLDKTLDLAANAQTCPDAEIRQRYVEALSWFGKDAIAEMMDFLNDGNSEVASTAFNNWELSVDSMDNAEEKDKVAGVAMKIVRDREKLTRIAAILEASQNRKSSILTLVDVVKNGNGPAAECARQAYESVTGEKWTDPSTATLKAYSLGVLDRVDN